MRGEENRCCGTCKHNKLDWTAWKCDEFFCGNVDSENHGVPTAYDDGCEDWEKKDG